MSIRTFTTSLEGAGWDYGTPLSDVKRITTCWKTKFDWKDAEAKINGLPNYIASVAVDGFDPIEVHFVHQKSEKQNAVPLIFIHGWPGSFLEVSRILPILAEGVQTGGPACHVAAPSLPNFGFSSAISKPGFGLKQYAETYHKLMLALGYEQYVRQGGDWGYSISRVMSKLYPSPLRAAHLSLVGSFPPTLASPLAFLSLLVRHILKLYTPAEKAGFTSPQTIGYSVADSPAGLLAWIYEKLHDWADQYPWTKEEVCTWVSLYWFSRAGPAASVRIYYEPQRGEFKAKADGYIPGVKLVSMLSRSSDLPIFRAYNLFLSRPEIEAGGS
ncbi:Alpha/Beta hydrolase protein [Clohesyomyces aquaticus]|uniref:Alpha/Beta hydrolase protein n=1 Tax=Clohesyomyces aquaticus TaxID=1231657 RepID=A0A1Y2A745_9PLEO|nr:Alpha/Beta hydrolase protein [Clohesyomyces aquaticus]